MNEQHPHDLLGAWALDAVDDVERAAVERLIREDPAAAAEARELQDTVGRLADEAAEEPPAQLRDRVLGAIADTPQQQSRAESSSGTGARQPVRRRWRWWAAAAAVAVAVTVPTTVAIQQSERAERAEQQVQAVTEALAEPDAVLTTADVTGGGRAAMVRGDDSVLMAFRELPGLDDRDYQMWLVEDGEPSPAGIINARDGRATAELADVPAAAALAVTIEPVGGSAQPTTEPVVVLGGE